MFYWIIRNIALILSKIIFRLKVYGKQNIPLKGGFILASNHLSYLDPPILGAACPRMVSFLAKEELFRNAVFARFIARLNAFPVKDQGETLGSLRRAIRKLRAGKVLTIFPQGRRIAQGQVIEPKRGVGFLAMQANVPIVPTFIQGSEKALPVDSKIIRPKKITVYFGSPLLPQKFIQQQKTKKIYQFIADETMKEIERLKIQSSR